MKKRLKQLYNNSTLTTKIRYSYFLLLLPVVIFSIFCFYNLWVVNRNYEAMLNSTVIASEFSLDFKKDFDYETYLLIVENKSIEESNLDDILSEANRVVNGLEEFTNSEDNEDRLNDVKKYLKNLESYKERIEENLNIWDFQLSEEDYAAINALDLGHSEIIDHSLAETAKWLNGWKIHD